MGLDRNSLLAAGLAVADEHGLEAVTMRGLAARLGVTPMALYNHVGGRTDLLDGMAELVASEIEQPPPGWPWRRRLRTVVLGTRRACIAHPAGVPLLQGAGALSPALLRPVETGIDALADAGLRPQAALTAWAALIGLTFGHVSYQLAGHMRGPGSGRGAIDPEVFPRIAAMAGRPALNWDRAFERALDALVDGLTARPGRARGA
jgi:AcrR family transcriptional regulator